MSSPTPSLSEQVITVLKNNSSVTAIIGTGSMGNPMRCYRMRAPQDVKQPYMVVWFPTHKRPTTLKTVTNLENTVVRFDFFGTNFLQLDTLRDTVIQLMADQLHAVYGFGTEMFEDDTRLYHLLADFSVWYDHNS